MSAVIRPLTESDLPAARRILRTAFGTFLGAPDPENFWADLDYVYGRFAAEHVASVAAEMDGELVGSNFVTKWGSVGFFGPLTVDPDRQAQGTEKTWSRPSARSSTPGASAMPGCLPSRRVQCTWRCIRNSASTPAS